jgi:hypothetical protein
LRRETLLGILLLISFLLGVEILIEDLLVGPPARLLWAEAGRFAPIPHVYALIAFVIVDAILAVFIFRGRGLRAVRIWSVLQILAMVLDSFTAPFYDGLTPQAFSTYLFGIWAFDVLLAVRVITAVAAFRSRPRGN